MLPGIFEDTIFSRMSSSDKKRSSPFLRPMHPKTEIRPSADAIRKILDEGWVGQLKIHGHRAQIHISPDPKDPIRIYNRQGQIHRKPVPAGIRSELQRLFAPKKDWNVFDAEWIKDLDRIFVFDVLKEEGESLHRLNFIERWKRLPREYLSPSLQTLGVFTSVDLCLQALQRKEEYIEGLVFKSPSPGFEDRSIIRCRRNRPLG